MLAERSHSSDFSEAELVEHIKAKRQADVNKMLEQGLKPDFVTIHKDHRASPLMIAIQENATDIVIAILNHTPVNPNKKTYTLNYTPLCWAIYCGLPNMVEIIIQQGAQVHEVGYTPNGDWGNGLPPLLFAATKAAKNPAILPILETLLKAGACVYQEIVIYYQRTWLRISPMIFANLEQHSEIRFLLTQASRHRCSNCSWRSRWRVGI